MAYLARAAHDSHVADGTRTPGAGTRAQHLHRLLCLGALSVAPGLVDLLNHEDDILAPGARTLFETQTGVLLGSQGVMWIERHPYRADRPSKGRWGHST